ARALLRAPAAPAAPAAALAPTSTPAPALSAGQRQVVSLARALLLDPAVLVLDEATANVDPATAATLERMIDAASRGRTTIVVAHRASTAERLDRIVVVEEGRIVDDGPPRELLAAGGAYARLRAHADADELG
ncbi:ATP-binding cassette domain-containing protein, partial [Conexibacter stalactiti]